MIGREDYLVLQLSNNLSLMLKITQMNKAVTYILMFLILTACSAPQNKPVIWIPPKIDASHFEEDRIACEKIGLNAAGPKPKYQNVPRCGGRRGSMMAGSSCASAQHRVQETNRKNKEAWLSAFESSYNTCMLDKGYKLQRD